eukprot:scaffold55609_cov30-Phaeocystis_antarctica.AAC.1
MQRAHSGDAGGLRRDIAAAAHTHKSSGSPGPPCSGDWSMIYYPVASGGTPSRPILIAGASGSSPSDQTGAPVWSDGELPGAPAIRIGYSSPRFRTLTRPATSPDGAPLRERGQNWPLM